MKFDPKFNQQTQQKTLEKLRKSTKINKKHLWTGIWTLQGPQEGQNGFKRDRNSEFGGSPGTPGGSQKSPKKQKSGVRKSADLWSCVLDLLRAKGEEVYLSHPPSPQDPSLADLQNTRKNTCGMQQYAQNASARRGVALGTPKIDRPKKSPRKHA